MRVIYNILFISIFIVIVNTLKKKSYEFHLDHLEVPIKTQQLFDVETARIKKFNRTTYVIDGNFEIFIPITDDIVLTVTGNNQQGNEYRKIFSKSLNMTCSKFYGEKTIVPYLLPHTDLPQEMTCPFPSGKYSVNNFLLPYDQFPDYIPGGPNWRFDLDYEKDDQNMGQVKFYAVVTTLN